MKVKFILKKQSLYKGKEMNIVILDAKTLGDDINLSKLDELGKVIKYESTDPSQTYDRIRNATIVITNKVVINKLHMQHCPLLKLICIAATGMNNVDLDAAEQIGIEVKNVAGYSTDSVIQHTFTMLFYLLGHSRYYDDYIKSGEWQKSPIFTNVSRPFFELNGKTWGIIGLGDIGAGVARLASAFGVNIVYYSTSGKNNNDDYSRVELETLLQDSDIISIHAPLNDATYCLIGLNELKQMKSGVFLLNLGRGGIINEEDLAKVIDTQNMYVGLDVLEKEPMTNPHPLMNINHQERLYITPHIAWTSIEARNRLVNSIIENIKSFLKENNLSVSH